MLDCISTCRYKMNIFRLYLSILILGCNFCLSENEFNVSELKLVDQIFYKLDSVVLDQGLIYQNINAALQKYVFTDTLHTKVVKNVHGDSSGVRGAAWLS